MPATRTTAQPAEQLKAFLSKFSPGVAADARAALTRMRRLVPGAVEMVYDNYNALVIGFGPTERASEAIVSLAVFPRWVTLCFIQNGPEIADPAELLKGSGQRRPTRPAGVGEGSRQARDSRADHARAPSGRRADRSCRPAADGDQVNFSETASAAERSAGQVITAHGADQENRPVDWPTRTARSSARRRRRRRTLPETPEETR